MLIDVGQHWDNFKGQPQNKNHGLIKNWQKIIKNG
jgi:hypothetical protein